MPSDATATLHRVLQDQPRIALPPRPSTGRGVELTGERDGAAPLDLHEGIVDPGRCEAPERCGCERWPEHLRLLNATTGELLPGRCKATNKCPYCQRLYVIETLTMLTLDAMEYAPSCWTVLTAREHLTRADCRRHLEQLRRAARERWPQSEWFVQVEFQRRGALHLNLLHKGIPAEDVEALHDVLSGVWCGRVDAEPVGQWSGAVESGPAVFRYLQKTLAHGLKREQAPPIGWRGHRTSQTRGYLVRPASVMREEARADMRDRRRLWKALDLLGDGAPVELVEMVAADLEERETAASWSLVKTRTLGRDEDRRRREAARAPFRETAGKGRR